VAGGLRQRVPSGKGAVLLIALGAVVINLPLAHSSYYDWRLGRDGVETSATVVETHGSEDGDDHFVRFRLDRELDPAQDEWVAEVDQAAYERAEAAEVIDVRVLPDRPGTYEVDGQQQSALPWVITLVGDLMLLGVVLLYWRARPADTRLRLVATADVERCRPGPLLERRDDGSYVVCGDVIAIEDDAIVLDAGEHAVRVELDGHANPVGYQQPARVTGRP
jgi:hypothetical protein